MDREWREKGVCYTYIQRETERVIERKYKKRKRIGVCERDC